MPVYNNAMMLKNDDNDAGVRRYIFIRAARKGAGPVFRDGRVK